jgi:phosphoglucomutase
VVNTGEKVNGFLLTGADDFEYKDPVDGAVASKQGVRLLFENGTRAVFRLSGTGSTGATIRMYLESFEGDVGKQGRESAAALRPLAEAALMISRLQEFTNREAPTVTT